MASGRRAWRTTLFVGCCVGALSGGLLISGCEKQPARGKQVEQPAAENQATRMTFQELFDVNGNTVTPKKIVRVGPTTMTPDVPFEIQIMRIDGAPFSDYIGRDAEVRKEGEVYRVIRFY
jgi:hypothetical protein